MIMVLWEREMQKTPALPIPSGYAISGRVFHGLGFLVSFLMVLMI